jgi:hypothetical protein
MEESMKNNHLSEEDIASLLIEPERVDKGLEVHLKECPQCRKRIKDLEGFTAAFRQYVEGSEINWQRQRQRILAGLAKSRFPLLRPRWATALVLSFFVVASVFLLSQRDQIPPKTTKVTEIEFLEALYLVSDDMGEVELPQGLQALSRWEMEDPQQFLNFFSPLQEERDEKKDTTSDSLSNTDIQHLSLA